MTILTYPIENEEAIQGIIGSIIPSSVEITLKLKETLDEAILLKLKALDVKFLTPLK